MRAAIDVAISGGNDGEFRERGRDFRASTRVKMEERNEKGLKGKSPNPNQILLGVFRLAQKLPISPKENKKGIYKFFILIINKPKGYFSNEQNISCHC